MPPCLCVGLTGHVPPGGHCAPLETRAGLSPWCPQDSAMACRARCLVRVSTHLLSDRAKKVTLTRQVLSKAALFRGDHVIAQGDSSRAATHLKVRDLTICSEIWHFRGTSRAAFRSCLNGREMVVWVPVFLITSATVLATQNTRDKD